MSPSVRETERMKATINSDRQATVCRFVKHSLCCGARSFRSSRQTTLAPRYSRMEATAKSATILLLQGKFTEAVCALDRLLANPVDATPQLLCSRAIAHLGECPSW